MKLYQGDKDDINIICTQKTEKKKLILASAIEFGVIIESNGDIVWLRTGLVRF